MSNRIIHDGKSYILEDLISLKDFKQDKLKFDYTQHITFEEHGLYVEFVSLTPTEFYLHIIDKSGSRLKEDTWDAEAFLIALQERKIDNVKEATDDFGFYACYVITNMLDEAKRRGLLNKR